MSANTSLAREVVLALLRAGVKECCVAAGARNLPLLTVLAQAEADGIVQLWHFFEERCAGFFALGRVMVTRQPVAVITTSGTAAAELLPAIIEAHYQGLPLLAVTADRPLSWRNSGAPQAINQIGIYADYAGSTIDLQAGEKLPFQWWTALRLWNRPCHINVCFNESQLSDFDSLAFDDTVLQTDSFLPDKKQIVSSSWKYFFTEEHRSIVLVGGLHPSEIQEVSSFLGRLGWPIIMESTANLHFSTGLRHLCLHGGEQTLKNIHPSYVLRIGSVPHWRWWRDLEDKPDVAIIHFTRIPYSGVARSSCLAVTDFSDLKHLCLPENDQRLDAELWYSSFLIHSSSLGQLIDRYPFSEIALLRSVYCTISRNAVVYLGNSLPIREWHVLFTPDELGERHYYASRGANGIDGQLSTFFAVSAEAEESWGIFGDLTTLYDLAGPWILRQTLPKRLRLVIINNLGGDIFSRLPSVRGANERSKELVRNPHHLDFQAWSQMWGMDYLRVTHPQELQEGLAKLGPVAVIELAPDAEQSASFWQHYDQPDHSGKEAR